MRCEPALYDSMIASSRLTGTMSSADLAVADSPLFARASRPLSSDAACRRSAGSVNFGQNGMTGGGCKAISSPTVTRGDWPAGGWPPIQVAVTEPPFRSGIAAEFRVKKKQRKS